MGFLKTDITKKGYRFYSGVAECPQNPLKLGNQVEGKGDLVCLQVLKQLIDGGDAQTYSDHVLIPHLTIAKLPEEERECLGLPDPFPFDIEITSMGNLADPSFKYQYKYLNGGSGKFLNPNRIGSLLEISSEEKYTLVGNQYRVLELIDEYNNSTRERNNIKTNYLKFSEIKELTGKCGFSLEKYLNDETVATPQNICLRLNSLKDGSVEILPIFCNESEIEEGFRVNKNILNDEQEENLYKRFRLLKTQDIYPTRNGPKLILTEKQKKGLDKLKTITKIDRDNRIVLQYPQSFFDPDVIDFDKPVLENGKRINWSDRVIEIGEYSYKAIPFIRSSKEPWLPEGGLFLDDDLINIPSEDRPGLKEKLEVAIEEKKPFVDYQGKRIPARPEIIVAINELIKEDSKKDESSDDSTQGSKKEASSSKVLIIKDNIEQDEFGLSIKGRIGNHEIPIPLKPGKSLFSHQQAGINWLKNSWIKGYKGCLLADDMGLGKTLQALAFISWINQLRNESEKVKILIVAPVVLLENWKNEYGRFMEPIFGPFFELHGSSLGKIKIAEVSKQLGIIREIDIRREEDAKKILQYGRGLLLDLQELKKHKVILTTYETARDYQFSLGLINWDVLVLDEGQKIKTPNAMVTSAIKAMKYNFGLVLTGTPIENSWVDLWSILDFTQPGYLGSLREFSKKYHHPLQREDVDRESLGNELKEKVNPIILRRMKEGNLEGLPKKIIKKHPEIMPQIQFSRYLDVIKNARSASIDPGSRKTHIFNTICMLRDISLHPDLPYLSDLGFMEKSDKENIEGSARLLTTFKLLSEVKQRKEKAIIFLLSRKMQRVLKRLLDNKFQLETHVINGEVKGPERQRLIDAFQGASGFNIIILSPEAAGVGLNIIEANHVIHLSRVWNPAKEDQASDRVYRIGQKRDVYIHIPMAVHPTFDNEECKGTFDLKIDRLLDEKRDLHKRILVPSNLVDSDFQGLGEEILGVNIEGEVGPEITILDTDSLSPERFEKLIAELFKNPRNNVFYQTIHQGGPNDQGADVIGFPHGDEGNGMLIQCKHSTNINRPQGNKSIQEIVGSKGVYEKKYGKKFDLIVTTNSIGFTNNAKEIARGSNVQLIAREHIKKMLMDQKISFSKLT